MSRELKFRAYDKGREIMTPAFGFCDIHDGMYINENDGDRVEGYSIDLEEDDVDVMQCAGLKDGGGKEIYEGDILKTLTGKGEAGVVLFVMGGYICHNSLSGLVIHIQSRSSEVAIVGNIHQNPELIEGD